ncbi:MAG: NAD(P)H-dependent oxidoreductase subunit E [Anaerolineales bacterium]|nr:NAD(P)H-dependent oxidoreductase subunit E [Anaerolineales bacterium]
MLVLNEVQGKIGHVSSHAGVHCTKLNVPLGQVHGVVTFYSFFKTKPRGKHTIKFCLGTACYVAGVPQLIEKAKQNVKRGNGRNHSRWADHIGRMPLRGSMQSGSRSGCR